MASSINSNLLVDELYKCRHYVDGVIVAEIINATYSHPRFPLPAMRDALSTGQLGSKVWLARKLGLNIQPQHKILIVGGWIGSLARILFENTQAAHITSIDLDEMSNSMARQINAAFDFTAITQDMYVMSPEEYAKYDVVINTSCEHISDVKEWVQLLRPGTYVAAQSNNFFSCDQHINCVNSEDELESQLGLSQTNFKGSLDFPGVYTRYMVIGRV
jgi:threonine dehydrogenase-like Zn-dependent dehydrogenase